MIMVLPDKDFVLDTVEQCILIEDNAGILACLTTYLETTDAKQQQLMEFMINDSIKFHCPDGPVKDPRAVLNKQTIDKLKANYEATS